LAIGTHFGKVILYDIIKGINKNLYLEIESDKKYRNAILSVDFTMDETVFACNN